MITLYRRNPVAGLAALMGLGAAFLLAGIALAELPTLPLELEKLRAALEKYQDPYVAVRDGYFSTLACIDFPRVSGGAGMLHYKTGGMGVHFLNPKLIGPEADPMQPPVLFGQPFDGPMEGHEPVLPSTLNHYDLHAWLWKANPNGLFSATNSSVKCQGYEYTVVEKDAPHIVPDPKP